MSGTLTRFSTIARMENELIKGNIYPSSESRINAIYPSRKYRGEYLSYTGVNIYPTQIGNYKHFCTE